MIFMTLEQLLAYRSTFEELHVQWALIFMWVQVKDSDCEITDFTDEALVNAAVHSVTKRSVIYRWSDRLA